MDQVYENNIEELHDIGICQSHNRLFECYCTQCNCIICPSCLMFDVHRGHPVCPIEQGSKTLRQAITLSSKEGLLKFDKTQNFLLDIRHAKLTVEQNKVRIIQSAEASFDKLIDALKNRKVQFIQQLKEHYEKEISNLQGKEEKWMDKQQKAQKILEYQKSKDELKLIENAQFIVQSLSDLRAPAEKQVIQIVDNPKTDVSIGNQSLSIDQLVQILRNFMKWKVSSTSEIKA